MRQIILDTETTGLSPDDGHRIIEIGCVELVNRKLTDNRYHVYLNPDREIDAGAIEVHGISNQFLADKPRFEAVVEEFLGFVSDAELIIHNAPFDVGFLNHELSLCNHDSVIEECCAVIDTLLIARKKHPGQRNSLDALCKRYGIDNSHRELHGALLDAEILADVYLAMTGGQISLLADEQGISGNVDQEAVRKIAINRPKLKIMYCNSEEIIEHQKYLDIIDRASGGKCLWMDNVDG